MWRLQVGSQLALILLAGLRVDELRGAGVGGIRTSGRNGSVIHVRGKGSGHCGVPTKADLISVIEDYLDCRAIRFPTEAKSSDAHGFRKRTGNAPLFIWPRRPFRRADPDAPPVRGTHRPSTRVNPGRH